jgi:hypothetical protein
MQSHLSKIEISKDVGSQDLKLDSRNDASRASYPRQGWQCRQVPLHALRLEGNMVFTCSTTAKGNLVSLEGIALAYEARTLPGYRVFAPSLCVIHCGT